jgi:predicted AlkP superfamily phosphohydrolase/phosphomutase
MREEPADLTAILFDGVDKLQHLCWRFIDEECRPRKPSAWEEEIARLCEGYFRDLDALIAEIAVAAGADATLVLASDHGFGPSSDIFYVNTWLEQQGYLAWAGEGSEAPDASHRVGIGHLARHVFELDWQRTVAYAATPSGQGIHIVRRGPEGGPGVPPESYDRVRHELAAKLRALRHPATDRPVVAELWTREEAFAGPYEALAPDLTLLLEDNGVVSILRSDAAMKRRPEPVGSHHPVGVFLARGPGLRAGATLPELSILDVAPLLLDRLGVPLPADLAGRVPVEAFEPGESRRMPRAAASARRLPAIAEPDTAPPTLPFDEEEEAVVLKRLKALGYVE